MGYALLMFNVGALTSFMPKYLEEMFHLQPSKVNVLFGGTISIVMCVGLLGGGVLVRLFQWSVNQRVLYSVVCMVCAIIPTIIGYHFTCFKSQDCINDQHPLSTNSTNSSTPSDCEEICSDDLTVFLAMLAITTMFASSLVTVLYTAILRSVDPDDKPTATGVLFFVTRLFGFIPAPIVSGMVFDNACISKKNGNI